MAMAVAMAFTTTPTPSQFQLLGAPKKVGNQYPFHSISSKATFNFLTPNSLHFETGHFGLICEAASGLQVSVADSEDSISLKNALIVVESQDTHKIQVRVDVTGPDTQRVFDLVLTNLARTAPPIPGFRREKGGKTSKVPKSFLLGILGEERVTKFVLQEIVSSSVAQYVIKEDLKVKEDKVSTTQSAEELKASFKPGSDFGFSAIIELQTSEVVDDTQNSVPS